jgi:hypothetical protein
LNLVIPGSTVEKWLEALTSMGPEPSETLAHTVVQIARFTGDRERDIDESRRDKILAWLDRAPRPDKYQQMLRHPESSLLDQEREWVFGESLPVGLVMTSSS